MWNQSSTGGLDLELSDHSIEWGYLVRDHDMEPIQHWGTQPRAEWPFFEWRHLVSYQEVESVQHWGTRPRAEWPFFERRHLVSYQEFNLIRD